MHYLSEENRSYTWIFLTKRMIPQALMKWHHHVHLKSQENLFPLRRGKEIHSFSKLRSLFDWILSHNLVLIWWPQGVNRLKTFCTDCTWIRLIRQLLIVCQLFVRYSRLYLATILDSSMKRKSEKCRKIHMIRSCKFFSARFEDWI